MPRAENRKRPPNSLGNVPGSGVRNRGKGMTAGPENETAKNSKQSVLEKMKKLQQDTLNRKSES